MSSDTSKNAIIKRGVLYLAIATFVFSSMEVAIKATNGCFNPIQLNLLRFFIGGCILLPFAHRQLKHKQHRLTGYDWRVFLAMGLACVVVSMSLYTISLLFIPSYQDAILFSCNTFFGILLSSLFLKEHLSGLGKTGLGIAFLGMLIIIDPLHFTGSFKGVVLVLASAFTFAIYSVFCKALTKNHPIGGLVVTCFGFFCGCAELLVLVGFSHIEVVAHMLTSHHLSVLANIPILGGITAQTIYYLAYISICVTGLGFASYFKAIELLGVTTSTIVFFIKPVLAPIFAFFILGEVISQQHMVGLAIIMVGSSILFTSNLIRK